MADVANFAIALEDRVSSPANRASASIDKLKNNLGDVKGMGALKGLGDLGGATTALESSSVAAGALAIGLGFVTAAAGVAVGALGGLVSLLKFGVHKALDEANEKARFLAGFDALGGEGAGEKTMEMLDELGAKLPTSEADLVKWTKSLQAMGITDLGKIRSELVAVASAQAIMGDEGAAAYQKIQQRVQLAAESHHGLKLAEKSLTALYKAGVNETEVAKRMGMSTEDLGAALKAGTVDAAKFGDALRGAVTAKGKAPLEAMMSSLDAMGKRLGKVFGDLFEDVDTKPLTDALRSVIGLLDKGQPSGEAMGKGITGGLNLVMRGLGAAITEAEVFFLTMELRALQAEGFLKPVGAMIDKIGAGLGAVGKVIGAGKVGEGIKMVGSDAKTGPEGQIKPVDILPGLGEVTALWSATLGSLGDEKALEVARAGGEKSGKAALEGIKDGLDVHSPSRAAIRIGMQVGAGLGEGMEDSPAPARAARTISSNALGGMQVGAAGLGGAANSNAGPTSNVVHVTINAPDGVTDAQELSVIGLATALERFQIGSGR